MMVPSKAHRGGNQPCSIQHIAAHIAPKLINTPNQPLPVSFRPRAMKSDCSGGYLLAYVGRKFSWNVSKCIQSGGVGFASRPAAKVSAPRMYANSSWMTGSGGG